MGQETTREIETRLLRGWCVCVGGVTERKQATRALPRPGVGRGGEEAGAPDQLHDPMSRQPRLHSQLGATPACTLGATQKAVATTRDNLCGVRSTW